MSEPIQFVTTAAIRQAVKGREEEVLDGIGVGWRNGRPHINCPYRDHVDDSASWRWDSKHAKAFCTFTKADGIFDVVMKIEICVFEVAKIRVAELLNLRDLIRTKGDGRGNRTTYQATDAASLLSAPADRRDDSLPVTYLAHRLGVAVAAVPIPSTAMTGLKALGYWDPPQEGSKAKPKLVGEYPCAVFATVGADGGAHAHRIYLAAGGAGKADLGIGPDGWPREPKKSAKSTDKDNIAGRSVLWGDRGRAPHIIVTEGIETGAAVAFAFAAEVKAGEIVVAAAISATGVEAFQLYPATTRITLAADRDEGSKANGKPGSRRGERAARAFAMRHSKTIDVGIALPGDIGASVDWLDVLLNDGVGTLRNGLLGAVPFVPTAAELEDATERQSREAELREISAKYPLPAMDNLNLVYAHTADGKAKVHKVIASK